MLSRRAVGRCYDLVVHATAALSIWSVQSSGQSVSNMTACTFSYNENGVSATYDVSSLTNDYGAYAINDRYKGPDLLYSYYFNVCQEVESESIPNGANCSVSAAGAYQVGGDDGFCKATGQVADGSFQLLSEYLGMGVNPAMGIVLSYENGELCGATSAPRQTHIVIECSHSENIPDEEEMQESDRICDYVLELPSTVGCPLECPLGGTSRQICSGRGVCGLDGTTDEVRCFCFEGAYGSDCADDSAWTESNTDTITAVFAVLVVFVILVLVGSFFMWRRVRALKLDPKQYGHTSASTDGVEMSDQGLSGLHSGSDDDSIGGDDRGLRPPTTVVLDEHDEIGQGQDIDLDSHDDSSEGEEIDLGLQDTGSDDDYI